MSRFTDDIEKTLSSLNLATLQVSKKDRKKLGVVIAARAKTKAQSASLGVSISRYSYECLMEMCKIADRPRAFTIELAIRDLHARFVESGATTLIPKESAYKKPVKKSGVTVERVEIEGVRHAIWRPRPLAIDPVITP